MTTTTNDAEVEAILVEFLRDRDYACPVCGQNIRGLTAAKCSTCGVCLTVGLGHEQAPSRWLILLAAGIAGTVTSGFLVVYVLQMFPARIFRIPRTWPLLALLGWSVLFLAAGWFGGNRFRRLSLQRQTNLAITAWFGVLVGWVAIMLWMR